MDQKHECQIRISENTHSRLKEHCENNGQGIGWAADKIIEKYLSDHDKNTPPQL